jgi:hypothetical protein
MQLEYCDEQYGTKLVEEFGMHGCDIIDWVLDALLWERGEKAKLTTQLDFANQQLAGLQAHHESDHAKYKEELELSDWLNDCAVEDMRHVDKQVRMQLELINQLTPDAQAWREQEARRKTEQDEMQNRIDDCRNGVK